MTIEEVIQIKEYLRHLKDEVHDTKVMVKNLDHSIRGNGKPGLLQWVLINEVAQKIGSDAGLVSISRGFNCGYSIFV